MEQREVVTNYHSLSYVLVFSITKHVNEKSFLRFLEL